MTALSVMTLATLVPQPAPGNVGVKEDEIDRRTSLRRQLVWKQGEVLRIRVPVARPGKEFMTTVSFPEDRLETATTGWPEGGITARANRGILFLRLPESGQGHVNVIGASGNHYLLFVQGVETDDDRAAYDTVVMVKKDPKGAPSPPTVPRQAGRPVGSIALIRAMRLGQKPEGATILRAAREEASRSPKLVFRLLYVYKHGSYIGRIYEIENLTKARQPIDATRIRGKGERLVLSGLRENVIPANGTSRLFTVSWRD